jgi:hypothetical protein
MLQRLDRYLFDVDSEVNRPQNQSTDQGDGAPKDFQHGAAATLKLSGQATLNAKWLHRSLVFN